MTVDPGTNPGWRRWSRRRRPPFIPRLASARPHLLALGVGAIVGTGIFTLIGVGADRAGPAVLLSFAVAGAICACAALAYAEMATMLPAAGSAYSYSYAVLGETIAWVVGWSLILGCAYLFLSLPTQTLLWCLLWNAIGLAVYVGYGRRRSLLAA